MTDEERAQCISANFFQLGLSSKPALERSIAAALAEVRAAARAEALEEAALIVERQDPGNADNTSWWFEMKLDETAKRLRALAQAAPAEPDTKKGPPSAA